MILLKLLKKLTVCFLFAAVFQLQLQWRAHSFMMEDFYTLDLDRNEDLERISLKYMKALERALAKGDQPRLNELGVFLLGALVKRMHVVRQNSLTEERPDFWYSRQGR